MIIPDANLLLYSYDSSSPFHAAASAWWSKLMSGAEPVGFATAVLFAFVRIATSARAFERPMTIQTAAAHVRTWLQQPVAMLIEMHPEDVDCALGLLSRAGAGGNLTTDAQLAALAIRHRAVVHTADSDFARFPEVRWKNPLIGG